MQCTVYMLTNLLDGQRYIGVTSQRLTARIADHFKVARYGKSLTRFHRAIVEHGRDGFSIETLYRCDDYQEALRKEVELIAAMTPAYNMTSGGQGVLGMRHTPEARALMSITRKGRPTWCKGLTGIHSPEGRAAMSAARKGKDSGKWKGRRHTDESLAKMSASHLGQPGYWQDGPPASTIAAMRAGYHATIDLWRHKLIAGSQSISKKTVCLDDGNVFPSAAHAARHYAVGSSQVVAVCRGRKSRRTAGGFRFAYVSEPT